MIPSVAHAANGSFAGGNGTVGAPYQIEDCADLQAIDGNMSANYILINDIDCSAVSNFSQIGSTVIAFTGTLNGQGYAVSDVSVSTTYAGMFGNIGSGATVENLGFKNPYIDGSTYSGVLTSYLSGGTVSYVYVGDGTLVCSNAYCGGLVGYMYEASSVVTSSYSNVNINNGIYVGGVVGRFSTGTIANVYASGIMTGSQKKGIIGSVDGGVTPNVTGAYFDATRSTASTESFSNSKTTAQMMTQSTFSGWDFTVAGNGTIGTWIMAGYPHLQMEHRQTVTTITELQLMAVDLTASYTLANNLTCTNCSSWNGGSGFAPVGHNTANRFSGSFNGQGYEIDGLNINRGSTSYIGLFGWVDTAGYIKEVGLTNAAVTSSQYAGPLIGRIENGTVSSTFATGNIYSQEASSIGGLIGYVAEGGTIRNSYAHTNAVAFTVVGGFVGTNAGTILNSYSKGSVTESGGMDIVGGLVGSNVGTITDSFYDTQTSGQSGNTKGTGKTTVEMKSLATFTDTATAGLSSAWDFVGTPYDDLGTSSIWDMDPAINSGYAFLAWQQSDTSAPSTPSSFVTEVSGTTISLSWINPTDSDFISLTLRRGTSSFPSSVSDGTAVTSSMVAESFSQTSLEDGTYYYSLFALDNNGNASVAATSSASIDTTGPSAVSSLSGSGSGTSAILTWTNPVDGDFSSITIRRSTSAYPSSITDGSLATSSITGTSFTNTGLAEGLYYYGVFALDTTGNVSNVATTSVQIDTTAPIITLLGSATVSQNQGQSYTDAGATATDAVDGDLTDSISTSGSVNINVPGTYIITYSVSDAAGNAATSVVRTVTILSVGGGSISPAPSSGGGASDRSVGMNQVGDIGVIDQKGVNYLAYIHAKAHFSLIESASGKAGKHTLTITSLDLSTQKTVTLEVASTPKQFTLQLGQQQTVDLDGDKKADLSVAFVSVVTNRVELTLSAISHTAVKDLVSVPEKASTGSPVVKETNGPAPVSATLCPSPLFTRDLRRGSTGEDVLVLQQYLNQQAVPVALNGVGSRGQETNYFGGLTEQAVRVFQEKRQIVATFGVFDYPTRLYLGCESVTSNVMTSGFTRNLSLGMTGSDVETLQKYLNTHGFVVAASGFGSPGKETTYFGPATQAALRSFQQANGLPAYGYFGPLTRASMQQ